MAPNINRKKIYIYLLLSFGISWTVAAAMKLLHIELGSISATVLLGLLYMPGPAIATFITQKLIYKEGFQSYGWSFDKKALKWLFLTPLFFLALIGLTFVFIGIFGNTHVIESFGQLDFTQENFDRQFMQLIQDKVDVSNVKLPSLSATLMFGVFILQGILAGATVNVPFMFGEELGWRGLMLKETQSLGFIRSALLIGLVWGLWHLPIILMGHNYPSNPYAGVLMMCVFTISLCPLFAYVRLKTKTILGPCLLHGMINATGALFVLYVANGNDFFSSIAGWAGVLSGLLIGVLIYVLDKPFVRQYSNLS